MGDRKSKRQCLQRSQEQMPSAVHYVGYVEDDETPESIVHKFEELERIQAAARDATIHETSAPPRKSSETAADTDTVPAFDAPSDAAAAGSTAHATAMLADAQPAAGEGLTDEQLMQVFKQTSIFTVRSAADGNAALMQRQPQQHSSPGTGGGDSADELVSDEDDIGLLQSFWSDDDDQDYSDHWKRLKRLRRKRLSSAPTAPRERGVSSSRPRHDIVTHYNAATQALIRRKVRPYDADAITRIQMPPPPLPVSWGRTVQPYVPPQPCVQPVAATAAELASHADAFGRTYQAVLVQPGWAGTSAVAGAAGDSQLAALARVPMEQLCPVGFVFVWADKSQLHAVVRLLYQWRFAYVENLTWVHMGPNNRPLAEAAPYARCSHSTLLMFRKDGLGKDIELRHQRKPDVVFDCIRSAPGGRRHMPDEVYIALETLLPTGKGQFLELWAVPNAPREGWTQVVDLLQL